MGASLTWSRIQQLLRFECTDSGFVGAFSLLYCLTCPFCCRLYFVTFQVFVAEILAYFETFWVRMLSLVLLLVCP